MASLVEALLKLVGADFTWRRIFGLLAVLSVVIAGLLFYDWYTASFTLKRLSRVADLISKVQVIEASPHKRSPELEAAYQSLRLQVADAVASKPKSFALIPTSTPKSGTFFWSAKFWAAALPWILITGALLPRNFRKGGTRAYLIGGTAIAFFGGILALLVPTFWPPWGNLFIVPLSECIAVVVLGTMTSAKKDPNSNGTPPSRALADP